MPYDNLDDNLKNLLQLMAEGLQENTIKSMWTPIAGGDRLVVIDGVNPELAVEVGNGNLQQGELNLLVYDGFLLSTSRSYTLVKQKINDAVISDFEGLLKIDLEQDQKDLLCTLVEAFRNTPSNKKEEFLTAAGAGGTNITHSGLVGGEIYAYSGDIDALIKTSLLAVIRPHSPSEKLFDVSPLGFRYYRQIKRSQSQPLKGIEKTVRSYFDVEPFRSRFPGAYAKWREAEDLLWATNVETQYSTIGHLCREAVQEFVTALVDEFKPPKVDTDKAHTVARLKAVISARSPQLGTTVASFLETLLPYFGTICDLIQRQEHGSQKEGQPLVWEDARRVVFQTAVVMFEIDQTLPKIT